MDSTKGEKVPKASNLAKLLFSEVSDLWGWINNNRQEHIMHVKDVLNFSFI